jgi:predicted nucleotidyltransferase
MGERLATNGECSPLHANVSLQSPTCYTHNMALAPRTRARRPRKVTPRLIRQMARRLVKQFDPDQIILFGSHARGDAGPDSDVDLLVVMPVKGSKREKRIEMQVALHDILVAKDIIVVTPDEVVRRRNIPGTIVRPALLEGQVLYART